MTEHDGEPSGASRWLVALLILGLSAWTAFTIFERIAGRDDAVAAEPAVDARLEGFVSAGQKHLAKGELKAAEHEYTRASGLAEDDPRVLEGLAQVQLLRAEQTWWNLTFGKHDSTQRAALLKELDGQVDRGRQAAARALERAEDEPMTARLQAAQGRLDAMLVVALALHGDEEKARGAIHDRLAEHPQRKLLEDFVTMVGKPRPETEEDAGEDAADAGPGPLMQTQSPAPPPAPPRRQHYELDQEPTSGLPKTPGELEITVGKEKVEKKVLPEPAPAPPPPNE